MDEPAKLQHVPDLREILAAERTFLAWIRTGVALMGFGFVVARFGIFLQEVQVAQFVPSAQAYGLSLMVRHRADHARRSRESAVCLEAYSAGPAIGSWRIGAVSSFHAGGVHRFVLCSVRARDGDLPDLHTRCGESSL